MGLLAPLSNGNVSLIPFDDKHVEPLRAACAEDTDIWNIYPISMLGEHFDESMAFMSRMTNWVRFAVLDNQSLVGMTNYIGPDIQRGLVEIGGTYIAPSVRGTGVNSKMKSLLIEHAFINDFHTIEFKIDTRNIRSMRAVEKIGARCVTILEKNMTTWTGFVRDTAVFQLKKSDFERNI